MQPIWKTSVSSFHSQLPVSFFRFVILFSILLRLTFSCACVWGISQFSSFQKSFSVRHFDCQWIPPQYQPVRQRWKVQGSLFTRFKFENICSIQTDCADVKRGHQLTRVSGYLVNTCISQISKILNSRENPQMNRHEKILNPLPEKKVYKSKES